MRSNKQVGGTYEVDQSIRIEDMRRDSYIGIAKHGYAITAKLPRLTKQHVFAEYQAKRTYNSIKLKAEKKSPFRFFAPTLFAKSIVSLLRETNTWPDKLILDTEYLGYEKEITHVLREFSNDLSIEFREIGHKSVAHHAAYGAFVGKKAVDLVIGGNVDQLKRDRSRHS